MHRRNGDRAQLILDAPMTCTELRFQRASHLRNSRILHAMVCAAQGIVWGKIRSLDGWPIVCCEGHSQVVQMGHNAVRIVGLAGLSGFDFIQVLLDG